MRQLGLAILALAIPAEALAQDVYIRLEARRDPAEIMAAVERYAAETAEIVTYPAGTTWTAIAIGPIDEGREAARERLADLQRRGIAPRDAFVTVLESDERVSDLAALRGDAPGAAPDDAEPAEIARDEVGPAEDIADAKDEATTSAAPETHIRLEAFPDRAAGEAALTRWRELLPGAALWQLSDGWFAITIGPVDADAAQSWMRDWKAAGAMPADAFVTSGDRLGTALVPGAPPELNAPPQPLTLPPVAVMQDALRWAGHYSGEVDGKPGPQTTAALAAEMEAQGMDPASTNAEARAMQALLARRDDWRDRMGLTRLDDDFTGLGLVAPMARLEFLRNEHGLSIYGPKDESGAALILFNQPGGHQEMIDLAGLVTALGWVPHPRREIEARSFALNGENDTHIGHAEGRIRDGQVQGFVLIWPQGDAENAPHLQAEIAASFEDGAQ